MSVVVCRRGGCGDPAEKDSEWCASHQPPPPPVLLVEPEPPSVDDDIPLGGAEAQALLGITQPTWFRWLRLESFPEPEWTVNKMPAWRLSAVRTWLEESGVSRVRWPADAQDRIARFPLRGEAHGNRKQPAPHGTTARYTAGCKCDECRDGHAADVRTWAAKAREQGLSPDDVRHGTNHAYLTFGCRCAPCRAAHTEATRTWRASGAGS